MMFKKLGNKELKIHRDGRGMAEWLKSVLSFGC